MRNRSVVTSVSAKLPVRPAVVTSFVAAIAVAGVVLPASAAEFDAASYFKGRTITIVVTHRPGGGMDTQGRFLAQHWSRFIPGNPRIQVSNLTPKIAGLNYLYKSKPDGLTIGYTATLPFTLEHEKAAKFSTAAFKHIGSFEVGEEIWFIKGNHKYNSFVEARGGNETVIVPVKSSPRRMIIQEVVSLFLAEAFNLPVKAIALPQTGTAQILLDMERGILNSSGSRAAVWYQLPRIRPGWIKNGTVKPFAYLANENNKMVPAKGSNDVLPNAATMLKGDMKRWWDEFILPQMAVLRYLYVAPDTPKPVLTTLRSTLKTALADAKFHRQLEKLIGVKLKWTSGEDLDQLMQSSSASLSKRFDEYQAFIAKLYQKYTSR